MARFETDEHGEVTRSVEMPGWITTPAQAHRWTLCSGIAMNTTGIEDPAHPENALLAKAIYDSPIATDDSGPPPPTEGDAGQLELAEAFAIPTEVLQRLAKKRHRDRGGKFADEMKPGQAPNLKGRGGTSLGIKPGKPAPPKPRVLMSPGTGPKKPTVTLEQIEALGLNDWPEPTVQALATLHGYRTSAQAHQVHHLMSPGTDMAVDPEGDPLHGAEAPYSRERKVIHDQAVGQALAGLPTPQRPEPRGLASLLGVDHPITLKAHGGTKLTDEDKKVVRDAAAKARGGGPPTALFVAGGPASGKTTVLKSNPDLEPDHAVHNDPDALKEHLPEYVGLRAKGDRYAASAVHRESGDIAARLRAETEELGMNTVIDGTGNSGPGMFMEQLDAKRKNGYKVGLVYVTIPTEDAVVSSVTRAETEGRFVPIPWVREAHSKVSRVFGDEVEPRMADWDSLDVFDRSGHIATMHDGQLHEFEPDRMEQFRSKAGEWVQEAEMGDDAGEWDQVEGEAVEEPVAPEEWSVEMPHDIADWGRRPVPTYEDDVPAEEAPPPGAEPDSRSGENPGSG